MRLSWDQHDWDSLKLAFNTNGTTGTGEAVFGASAEEKHYYSIEMTKQP
jgi:hypothetical protein